MDNAENCNKSKCLLMFLGTALLFFVLIFAYEWAFHSQVMMASYTETKSVWRDEASMKNFCWVNLVREAVMALVYACVFGWFCKLKSTSNCSDTKSCCPVAMNTKLGTKLGLLVGITMFGSYMYLPLPSINIPVMWLVGYTLEGALLGFVFGLIIKNKCTKA